MRRLAPPPGLVALTALSMLGCSDCGSGGTQHAATEVDVSPSEVDFGRVFVGTTAQRTVELVNRKVGRARIAAARLEGDADLRLADRGSPEQLTLTVSFTPTALGPATGTLVVENDSENAPVVRVSLHGEGVPAPVCEDHESCTVDRLDLASGKCVFEVRHDGPCDDLSACTARDTCVDGLCRGQAVDCDDGNDCTRDACDRSRGCVHLPDTEICADADPCTADVCDPVSGCSHPNAPDFTPCGAMDGCQYAHVCVRGSCTKIAVPDGFPCSDGDLCTTGDTCRGGACSGTRAALEPVLDARLDTFGAYGALATILPGGLLVFVDGLEGDVRPALSVVTASGSGLSLVKTVHGDPGSHFTALTPVDAAHFLAFSRQGAGQDGLHARMFELLADGTIHGLGVLPDLLPGSRRFPDHAAQAYGDAIYACDTALPQLLVYDASDRANIVAAGSVPLVRPCEGVYVNPQRGRLLLRPQDGYQLIAVDVTAPLAPTVLSGTVFVSPLEPVAYGYDVLAIGRDFDGSGDLNSVELYDAETFSLQSTMLTPTASISHLVAPNLALTRSFLVGLTYQQDGVTPLLVRYSTANLLQPTVLGQTALDWPGVTELVAATDELVLVRGDGVVRAFRFDPTTGEPLFLTGRSQGGASRVASHEGQVFAFDTRSAHVITVPRQGQPSVVEGGMSEGHGSLVRVNAGPSPRDVLVANAWNTDPSNVLVDDVRWMGGAAPAGVDLPISWLDATDPFRPRAGARLLLPGAGPMSARWLRSSPDGSLWTLSHIEGGRPVVARYVLDGLAPTGEVPVQPAGRLVLSSAISSPDFAVLGFSSDGARFVAVSRQISVGSEKLELVVVDKQGSSLQLVAQGTFDGLPSSVAVSGRTLLLATADGLSVYALDESARTLSLTGSLALPVHTLPSGNFGWHYILVFDGSTAIVSTPDGLVYVDVTRTPPRRLGALATDQAPRSAVMLDDRLVVGTNSSVLFVSPPCPPP